MRIKVNKDQMKTLEPFVYEKLRACHAFEYASEMLRSSTSDLSDKLKEMFPGIKSLHHPEKGEWSVDIHETKEITEGEENAE